MRRWDWLSRLVSQRGYKTGAEIGVLNGNTSRELLLNHQGLEMWGVDINPMPDLGSRFHRVQMPSVEAAEVVPDVDFVFIDADHSYEAVRADIAAWKGKCKFLCGHDFSAYHPGVVLAVQEYRFTLAGHDNIWIYAGPQQRPLA